jgi:hypothetical protein
MRIPNSIPIITLSLALTACAPGIPGSPVTPASGLQSMPSVDSTTPPELPTQDVVVFTIPNQEPFSGREGDPRPDWLGWGAEAFDVAPDGSYWIADTAVDPQRLLHYSVHGVQLDEISMEGVATSVYDLAAGEGKLWLLDLGADGIQVISLTLGRRQVDVISVPKEFYAHDGIPVANGIFSLSLAADGALMISGISGLTLLVDGSGSVAARPLPGWSSLGHVYRLSEASGGGPPVLSVDGRPVPMGDSLSLEAEPFLGFNADGTFPVVLRREVASPDGGDPAVDWLVAYLRPEGTAIGYASLPQRMPWQEYNHELALGPDRQVYALVSRSDHSVQVVRLGFETSRPTPLGVAPTSIPTPLTPLRADLQPLKGTVPADAQGASAALVSFFSDLSQERFETAAENYGGSFEELGGAVPEGGETTDESRWRQICQQYLCLPIAEVSDVRQTGPQAYTFEVVFTWPDGQRVEIGACCGGSPAASPPVWKFAYPVAFKDGVWKVMRGPLYVP